MKAFERHWRMSGKWHDLRRKYSGTIEDMEAESRVVRHISWERAGRKQGAFLEVCASPVDIWTWGGKCERTCENWRTQRIQRKTWEMPEVQIGGPHRSWTCTCREPGDSSSSSFRETRRRRRGGVSGEHGAPTEEQCLYSANAKDAHPEDPGLSGAKGGMWMKESCRLGRNGERRGPWGATRASAQIMLGSFRPRPPKCPGKLRQGLAAPWPPHRMVGE